jgi:hypothetical protein
LGLPPPNVYGVDAIVMRIGTAFTLYRRIRMLIKTGRLVETDDHYFTELWAVDKETEWKNGKPIDGFSVVIRIAERDNEMSEIYVWNVSADIFKFSGKYRKVSQQEIDELK